MSKARDKYLQDFKDAYFQYLNFLEKQIVKERNANPLAGETDAKLRHSTLITNYKLALQSNFDTNLMHDFLTRIETSPEFKSLLHDEAPTKNTNAIKNYEYFHRMAMAALKIDDPKRTKENKALHKLQDQHSEVMQERIHEKSKAERKKDIEHLSSTAKLVSNSDIKKSDKIASAKKRDEKNKQEIALALKKKQEDAHAQDMIVNREKERQSVKKTSVKTQTDIYLENKKHEPAISEITKLLADYKSSLKNEPSSKAKIFAITKIEAILTNTDPLKGGTQKEKFERAKKLWEHEKFATIFAQRRSNTKGIVKSKIFWLLDKIFNRKNYNFEFGVKGRNVAKQVNRLFDNPAKAMEAKSKSKLSKAKTEKTTSRTAPKR